MAAVFTGMGVRLLRTKTGPNKFKNIRSEIVRALLRQLMTSLSQEGDALLFPSAIVFRRHFKEAIALLGLSCRYVPHSLRHGGATHDYIKGLSIEDVLFLGGWESTKSARHYVQSGRSLLLSMTVPQAVAELARSLLGDVLEAMALAQLH